MWQILGREQNAWPDGVKTDYLGKKGAAILVSVPEVNLKVSPLRRFGAKPNINKRKMTFIYI